LILLHAIEPITQVYGWGADLVGSEVYLFEPEAIEPEWDSLLSEVDLKNVRWEQRTEQGLAASSICRAAADENADLIVIATHGRTALSHALLGSVAEAVLRQAPCSVLSVRSEAVTFSLP
jgi:nucleotide-binding universal stress UspA family protein